MFRGQSSHKNVDPYRLSYQYRHGLATFRIDLLYYIPYMNENIVTRKFLTEILQMKLMRFRVYNMWACSLGDIHNILHKIMFNVEMYCFYGKLHVYTIQ